MDATGAALFVDTALKYQEFLGFGGAFTEAVATALDRMRAERQREILKGHFSPTTGHGYSLFRIHINNCDFALGIDAYTGWGPMSSLGNLASR